MGIPTMKFKDFYNENKDKLGEYSLLFGNGLIKSYPPSAPLYDQVQRSVTLENQDICKIWKKVNDNIENALTRNEFSPEYFLNHVRRIYGLYVFKEYISRQLGLNSQNLIKPTKFLELFGSVYTLNNDYLTYVSIFDPLDQTLIKDGFMGNTPICLQDIDTRLNTIEQNERPYYFLHGAFHIFQRRDELYYKLASTSDSTLVENIHKRYTDIEEQLNQQSDDFDDPIIVFSGKSRNKLAAIRSNTYLTHCLQSLNQKKLIFTFGCSFELDSHILDAIFKDADGKKKDVKAYLGYFSKMDRQTIEMYVVKNDIDVNNVTLVGLSDKEAVEKYVWDQDSDPTSLKN